MRAAERRPCESGGAQGRGGVQGVRLPVWPGIVLTLVLLSAGMMPGDLEAQSPSVGMVHLPLTLGGSEAPEMPELAPGLLTPSSRPSDRPAALHPDLNLALRSYEEAGAAAELVDCGGATDPLAPQLGGLGGQMSVDPC